jgi:hypothetical protein
MKRMNLEPVQRLDAEEIRAYEKYAQHIKRMQKRQWLDIRCLPGTIHKPCCANHE